MSDDKYIHENENIIRKDLDMEWLPLLSYRATMESAFR